MCKDKKWACVFVRPRRRLHSMCNDQTWTACLLVIGLQSLSAAEQNPCVKTKSGRAFSFGCGDVTLNVDYRLAVVVCGGAQSMCKDIKWTCIFFRPRRRLHSMCKDQTWTTGLLVIGLQSLSAAEQKSMCTDKKWMCVFVRLRRRHTQCGLLACRRCLRRSAIHV